MDPELHGLGIELANVALRNTAGTIADRIGAAKARKRDQETIAELEEIINGLVSDKAELIRIAQAFEEELVAQRISPTDVEYITNNFVPILRQLAESGAGDDDGEGAEKVQAMLDIIQPVLSVETVTVLQLIGFNFRKAIGEPLTELLSKLILTRSPGDPGLHLEVQRLSMVREVAYLEVAKDADAYERLLRVLGREE